MKAEIPATIPASIVSAKAGLTAISAKIVTPAGTDLYNEFVNDVPMINNSGIAMISPTDHLPNVVFGIILSRNEYDKPNSSYWNLKRPTKSKFLFAEGYI